LSGSATRVDHGAHGRLTEHDLGRFTGDVLFDCIGRALCAARCLPRKELYEAWEVARRVRRLFRGGRIVDLAAGHGLLAQIMLVLDDSSPEAIAVDTAIPPSSVKVHDALASVWPRLRERVRFCQADLTDVSLTASDVVVSSHACGDLTDQILGLAVAARAGVAVLPCCHLLGRDRDPLRGWLDGPLAVDVRRAMRLEAAGYRVWMQKIPSSITPKNRLLIGRAQASAE
jgi:hypothetical protein